MATNLNNIHINSFTKGMNTDTSLDMVGNELYVFGLNVRITNNTTLGTLSDPNSKEGLIVPIDEGELYTAIGFPIDNTILATASIGDIGAIITKNEIKWQVYKVTKTNDVLTAELVFEDDLEDGLNTDQVSVVINKELDDVVNLYIADGYHEIMIINLCEDALKYKTLRAEQLISNRHFPARKITINKKITGRLHTSQVQYTFRFYKKHGIRSKLAPLTNKILIIDSNRNKEIGNAEDTETSVGLQLKLTPTLVERTMFDHLQVYRLSYLKPNTNADIDLIYDSKIDSDEVTINDTGIEALQKLSIEEFAALDTMDIIPQCIELNQNYLFAANVSDNSNSVFDSEELLDYDTRAFQYNSQHDIVLCKDTDTIYKDPQTFSDIDDVYEYYTLNLYVDINLPELEDPCKYDINGYYGGTGKNISWRFVWAEIPIYSEYATADNSYPNISNIDVGKIYYLNKHVSTAISGIDTSTICSKQNVCKYETLTYNDNIVSSIFKSLKRNEVYRYGIVFYDKNGNRSDVRWIADIRTPSYIELPVVISGSGNNTCSSVIGIQFDVKNLPSSIYGYQIVRCEKNKQTTKNIMLVVLSRPVTQELYSSNDDVKRTSPYYPSFMLTSSYQKIRAVSDNSTDGLDRTGWDGLIYTDTDSLGNNNLFQIFSPEICYRQNDSILLLGDSVYELSLKYLVYGNNIDYDNHKVGLHVDLPLFEDKHALNFELKYSLKYVLTVYRALFKDMASLVNSHYNDSEKGYVWDMRSIYNKQENSMVFNWFNTHSTSINNSTNIKDIKNVSVPNWDDGIKNVLLSGSDITSATLGYKSHTVSIQTDEYMNWVSNGMYNLRASTEMSQEGLLESEGKTYRGQGVLMTKKDYTEETVGGHKQLGRQLMASGYIGAGPKCFIISTDPITNPLHVINNSVVMHDGIYYIHSSVCNINHAASQFAGLTNSDKQYDTYYGFGNYYDRSTEKSYIFDGDTYIVPFELVTMYKTYNFNSVDTIPSAQFIYYLPIETPINTYFDYGMNYRNTQSKNLMLEPGEIEGVASQDRPQYQYNMIYSDNNRSNDIYVAKSLEDAQDTYSQRIFYSELKTSGESIDSWSDFKPLNYIDADTRHGGINNLLTSKDILYFWQDKAFGRLSVNERSLITDTNSNTIQLGQGGVIQRTDYISTTYGMRPQDFSAISIDGTIFWIDIKNNCIVQSNGLNAVNYSEGTNVLNIMNHDMSIDIPKIDYDVQNNELLCKCLKDGKQLVFNIKLNVATSVYTRDYQSMIMFDNMLYGLWSRKKYNNISNSSNKLPTEILFVVNPNSSTTKVFDNQQVVLIDNDPVEFVADKQFKFQTNTIDEETLNIDASTNREGDIWYTIPRYGNEKYGNRMRGKWMKLTIIDYNPTDKSGISHVITKFRQSFN